MFCYFQICWKITTEDHFTHTCVYQKFNHKYSTDQDNSIIRNKTKQQSQVQFAGMTLSSSHRVFSTVFHL